MSQEEPLEAVVFDLGGVVLGSPLEGIAEYELDNRVPLGFVNVNIVTRGEKGAFQRLERGEIKSMKEFYDEFNRELNDPEQIKVFADFKNVPRDSLPERLSIDGAKLFAIMMERSMRADPDFVHAIYMLRGSKVKVGALTNNFAPMGSSAPGSINIHALEDLFDSIVESAVEGVRKPDPNAFALACKRLGVDPKRAVMLDDIGMNLKGAKKLGMGTILVKLKNKHEALHTLERFLLERNGTKVSLVPPLTPDAPSQKLAWNVSTDSNGPPKYVVGDAFGKGANPPIVLFHGGGQTRHAWGNTCRAMAANGFFAIAVDMRGHGESYWDPNGEYSSHDFAKDIEPLIKKMGFLNRLPLLVGASLGGLAILSSSIAHTDKKTGVSRCAGVCLVDVTPRLERDGVDRIMTFMTTGIKNGFDTLEEAAEAIKNYQPHRKRTTVNFESLKKNLVYNEARRKWVFHYDPLFVDSYEKNKFSVQLDEYEKTMLQDASNVKAPVLLLKGKLTDIVSDQGVENMLKVLPQAEVRTVKDASHMVGGDQNDIFSEELNRFAQKVKPSMERSSLALLEPPRPTPKL